MRLLCLALLCVSTAASAEESSAYKAGRVVGDAVQGYLAPAFEGVTGAPLRTYIENVEPRDKDTCLKESGGTINKAYMRCRNGAQITWREWRDGRKEMIAEKPLPGN